MIPFVVGVPTTVHYRFNPSHTRISNTSSTTSQSVFDIYRNSQENKPSMTFTDLEKEGGIEKRLQNYIEEDQHNSLSRLCFYIKCLFF